MPLESLARTRYATPLAFFIRAYLLAGMFCVEVQTKNICTQLTRESASIS